MTRGFFILGAFLSPIFFPFWFTVLVGIAIAFVSPLAVLALGIFADALYYTGGAYFVPLGSLLGVVMATIGFFVRRFVKTSIIHP